MYLKVIRPHEGKAIGQVFKCEHAGVIDYWLKFSKAAVECDKSGREIKSKAPRKKKVAKHADSSTGPPDPAASDQQLASGQPGESEKAGPS